jgi:hypothetical protein
MTEKLVHHPLSNLVLPDRSTFPQPRKVFFDEEMQAPMEFLVALTVCASS